MQKREKVFDGFHQPNYCPNNYGFNMELSQNKTQCWTPMDGETEMNTWIQCLNVIKTGNVIPMEEDLQSLLKTYSIDIYKKFFSEKEKHMIAKIYNVVIDIYVEGPVKGGREIQFLQRYNAGGCMGRVALLKSSKAFHYFMLLLPNRNNNKLDLVKNKIYCNTCGNWRTKKDWNKHINGPRRCCKCTCGKTYQHDDGHYEQCIKDHYEKKKQGIELCRIYKKEEVDQLEYKNTYFADFECLVPEGHVEFVVYAAAWSDANYNVDEADKVYSFYGKYSLDSFMRSLINNCVGVLWFFNGAKFDNFFILKWLLNNKVRVIPRSILMTGSSLLSIQFRTKYGTLVMKDLYKFLSGSLDANCKQFGLPVDKSKSKFDHNKMKTWKDVYDWREEVIKYLDLDVIALKNVYKRFADSMFDLYKLDVGKFMTIGQMAYAAFSTTLGENVILYKTKSGEEEDIMRELYKGGRVICGRKIWKSQLFDRIMKENVPVFRPKTEREMEKKIYSNGLDALIDAMEEVYDGDVISNELYDLIGDDYLVDVDVNSLYPTVQVDIPYPHGTFSRVTKITTMQEKKLISELYPTKRLKNSKNVRQYNKKMWRKRAAKVDVSCPNDLTIAFLTEKNDKGGAKQDLLPKKGKWYTGPELWEACKLGYKVTKIYEYIEWEKCSIIFNDFVKPTYQVKCSNVKGSPMYATAKTALVALTGKFGQRNISHPLTLFYPEDILDKNLSKISEIVNTNGDFLCYYGEERKSYPHCPYPIELSAFILAHARVYMSRLLRKMSIHRAYDGHFDECPIYGDTDSLFLQKKSWDRLPDSLKGDKELGQIKQEVDGKIICAYVLAPKTYNIIYVESESKKIMALTKSKGIPHFNLPYNALEKWSLLNSENYEKAIEESKFLSNRRDLHQTRTNFYSKDRDITRRWYIFRKTSNGEVVNVCSIIPALYIEKILEKEYTLECIFGTMKRNIQPGLSNNIFIAPDSIARVYNKTSWWEDADECGNFKNRCFSPHELHKQYPTSYPIGHYMLDELIPPF